MVPAAFKKKKKLLIWTYAKHPVVVVMERLNRERVTTKQNSESTFRQFTFLSLCPSFSFNLPTRDYIYPLTISLLIVVYILHLLYTKSMLYITLIINFPSLEKNKLHCSPSLKQASNSFEQNHGKETKFNGKLQCKPRLQQNVTNCASKNKDKYFTI